MSLSLTNQYEDVGWDDRQAEVNQDYGPLRAYIPRQGQKEYSTLKFNGKIKNSLLYKLVEFFQKNTKIQPLQKHENSVFKVEIILRDPILQWHGISKSPLELFFFFGY